MPGDPKVIRELKAWREALDRREQSILEDMTEHWLGIERGLDHDIRRLSDEFVRRVHAQEDITDQMIWRDEQYQRLRDQMETQIAAYADGYAADLVSNSQKEYATLGIDAAQQAIQTQLGPLNAGFDKLNLSAIESMFGFAANGAPLAELLEEASPLAADGLMNALIEGVARGWSTQKTASAMADGMGMGLDRCLLIARTEMARAYRMGSVEQYRKSGVVHGFKRLVKKETACLACLLLDGETFDTDNDLDDHPNGKCIVVPIVDGVDPPEWETGKEWFENLDTDRQIEIMGPTRYHAWQDSRRTLDEMVTKDHNSIWGDAPTLKSLKDLNLSRWKAPAPPKPPPAPRAPRPPKPKPAAPTSPAIYDKNIANQLRTARYTSAESNERNKGAFESERVKLEGDGYAIRKPDPQGGGFRGSYSMASHHEAAAYNIADRIGINIVPPTVYREADHASFQAFVEGAQVGYQNMKGAWADPTEFGQMGLLDAIIANTDRHAGNWLSVIDANGGRHVIAIDHGLALSYSNTNPQEYMDALVHLNEYGTKYYNRLPLSKDFRDRLDGALGDGSLETIVRRDAPDANWPLVEERVTNIIRYWDTYFQEP